MERGDGRDAADGGEAGKRSEGQRRGEDKNGLITSLYETLRNASRRGSGKKEAGSNGA